MTSITASLPRDANRVPLQDGTPLLATKEKTYAGGAGGAPGGVGNEVLFTVTGTVEVRVFATCQTSLTGSGTVEVGVTDGTALLIAQTTGTAIDENEVWIDATPGLVQPLPDPQIITGGLDIIETIGTDTIDTGGLTYYCYWRPISDDGNVVAA